MEKFKEIIDKLNGAINNNPDYLIIDGVKLIYSLTKKFNQNTIESFILWVGSLLNNNEVKLTLNLNLTLTYFYEKETFSYGVAKEWLEEFKEEEDFELEDKREHIIKQLKLFTKEEAKAFLKHKRNEYVNELFELTENSSVSGVYNPVNESDSFTSLFFAKELFTINHPQNPKNDIDFRIPMHPETDIWDNDTPKMIFWKATTPQIRAFLMIEWLNQQIESKPKAQLQELNDIPEKILTDIYYDFKDIIEENSLQTFLKKCDLETIEPLKYKNGYQQYLAYLLNQVCIKVGISNRKRYLQLLFHNSILNKITTLVNNDKKDYILFERVDKFLKGIKQ